MKTAVITGGTKGIGKSIALTLLREGYFIWTNYAHDDFSAKTAEQDFHRISPNFQIIKANQSSRNDFKEFVSIIKQKCDKIHCIICNTGLTVRKNNFDITDEEWENIMFTSVHTHFYLVRDLHSKIAQDARIIFIGSMMGIHPHATSLPYGVSKAAIHALAMNLVKEFEGTATTVNVIAPGFVETDWQKNKPQEIRNNICEKTALKRFASPEEISHAVLFCIQNAFVNGSILEINGGYCFK